MTPTSGKVLINGDWIDVARTTPVINPARNVETVGHVGLCGNEEVDRALEAASSAFDEWSRCGPEDRAGRLKSAASALEGSLPDLIPLLARENGKPLREAERDIRRSIEMMEIVARDLPAWSAPELIEAGQPVWLRKRPRGVTAVISPWNSPVLLSFRRLVPAVGSGNTVVVKPASYCPLTVMECFRIIQAQFPPGVLNLVTGAGSTVGEALVRDARVSTVAFTGGTETGRRIVKAAASTVKKLFLELGGNDPAVVLEDAVLDESAIERMTRAILRASGQVCVAIKRIYVHESRQEELLEKLTAAFAQTVVGDPIRSGTTMGPLNNKPQFDFVSGLIEEARAAGSDVRTLGQKLDPHSWKAGYFMLPAIIAGAGHGDALVGCEQLGPVVPLVSFKDENQAVEWSNDTPYGLRASVWTSDRSRAENLADRIRAGAVFHNNHGIFQDLHVEFPGLKQSGLSRESRSMGLDHYTDSYGFAD